MNESEDLNEPFSDGSAKEASVNEETLAADTDESDREHIAAIKAKLKTATGIKLGGPYPPPPKPVFSALLDLTWTIVPWYARLLGFIRLPYDIVRFIVTGKFYFIPWPWRW